MRSAPRSASLQAPPDISEHHRRRGLTLLRRRLYVLLEAGRNDFASRSFDLFMVVLILANVGAVVAETEPSISKVLHDDLHLFDIVSVGIFTLEYLTRLWVSVEHPPLLGRPASQARLTWALTPPMLIDLAAILPFYLSLFFPFDPQIALLFRLVRFLKLARATPALGTLGRVLYNERRAIFGAVIIMLGLIVVSATVMFELEGAAQPEAFGSIPRAMWWAITTLTTIGYGDVVPVTPLGKFMAGFVMIAGFGMFALPVAIISTGFAAEIHRRDFVVTWGMVARVPLFNGLDAVTIGNLVQLLHAQAVEPGTVLGRAGDEATGMYFIMSGQVQIDFPSGPVLLGEGEFFGERALLESGRRAANITAVTRCTLLKLQSADFARFTRRHPKVHARIVEVARARILDLKKRSELEAEMAEIRNEKSAKADEDIGR